MGRVDYDAIIDETRRRHRGAKLGRPAELPGRRHPAFRTNPWQDGPFRTFAVAEKNGLAPAVQPITDRYLVPLYPTGGYNGAVAQWSLAKRIVQSACWTPTCSSWRSR